MRLLALIFALLLPPALSAQERAPIPEVLFAVTRGVDLPGGDLAQLFDTTLPACEAACRADPACRAYTYNERSRACFPKGDAGEPVPFAGAISGQALRISPTRLAGAEGRRAALPTLTGADLDRAAAFALGLGRRHPVDGRSLEQLLDFAKGADPDVSLQPVGGAITLTDAPDFWRDYAEAALAIEADGRRARELEDLAADAAVNAYLRAGRPGQEAAALLTLSRAWERQGRGRDALAALRRASELQPANRAVEQALDRAIGRYGLRVADTQVDSDAAAPRVCAILSEDVALGTDIAPYVQTPDPTYAVTVEGAQICLSGMTHGTRVAFTLRRGLPGASGEALIRPIPLTLYVRDRTPSVRFPGRGYVVPRTRQAALPVETVNIATLDLRLRRMSDRNLTRLTAEQWLGRPLSRWELEGVDRDLTSEIWRGQADITADLNADRLTRLPLAEALGDQPPGIYLLEARQAGVPEWQATPATQWFVLSDLGLSSRAGTDGLTAMVRGLGDAQARAGVAVQLISRSNAVLGEVVTDAKGIARFPAPLAAGTGGDAPGVLVARTDNDLAFLSLTDAAFDLSDRGVEGRAPPGALDAYLHTDRGAYRPGEVVHATLLARTAQAEAAPEVPLLFTLERPDGVEALRVTSRPDAAGGHVVSLPVPQVAARGTWRLSAYLDPDAAPLATTRLLVEDFVPERIDVTLDAPEVLTPGATLGVDAQYLYGAPGAGLAIEGEVALRPTRRLVSFPGFRFGRHDEPTQRRTVSLPASLTTDAQGQARVPLPLGGADGAGLREAQVSIRIAEASNRPVERSLTRPIAPTAPLIGLRPLFEGVVPDGAEARFEVISLAPDLTPVPRTLAWRLDRVETRYQWYQLSGDWRWEPITTRSRIAEGRVTAGAPVTLSQPVDWGRYELTVESTDGAFTETSLSFRAGWFGAEDGRDTPDRLEVALDRAAYTPGDTATLRIVSPGAGVGVIEVMHGAIVERRDVPLTEGAQEVTLPVTADWGPSGYVVATLFRPMAEAEGRLPSRAVGIAHAAVAPGARALDVALDLPTEVRPNSRLTVPVRVSGDGPVFVTLSAVDRGILNLTAHAAPDPAEHYFGQRRLGVELRDLYGRLIDPFSGAFGQVRSGGDARAALASQSPPPTEDAVALFSGRVEVRDGLAEVPLDLPAFDGTLRIDVVAWSAEGVGAASQDLIVRDPVVARMTLPRFLAPGDETRVLVELAHVAGTAGDVDVALTARNATLGAVPATVTLAEQGRATLPIRLKVEAPGTVTLDLRVTTPDGVTVDRQARLSVQSNDPQVAERLRLTLAPGGRFTLDDAALAGFQPGSAEATLTLGPLARFDAAGLARGLERFAYGCTEQVASQLIPQLYLGAGDDAAIATALDILAARQGANGGFGLWGAGSGTLWLDAYITDVLARARAEGHAVPDAVYRAALDHLANRVAGAPDVEAGDPLARALPYALLVLAREGAAQVGDLRYYADARAEAFAAPLAAAQLGAALALYGDPARSEALFRRSARALAVATASGDDKGWRTDFGTDRRDIAGVLTLAAEVGSTAVDRSALAAALAGATSGSDGLASTQEAAWTLMAVEALRSEAALGGGGITVDGVQVADTEVLRTVGGPAQVVENTGEAPLDLTL
ncbi:MAG: MG2 domain-containing protein, partial [Shimia sp.]